MIKNVPNSGRVAARTIPMGRQSENPLNLRSRRTHFLEVLTSCRLVRALLFQPSGHGSNPGGLVQSQLLQGGIHLATAYIHNLVL